MPTPLPRPRVERKPARSSVVLNAFMVVSALILTVIVLVQEERYAMGRPGLFADAFAQAAQQGQPVRSGNGAAIPPLN